MSNNYYQLLLEEKWTPKKTHKGKPWKGPLQYETPDGELMVSSVDRSCVFCRLEASLQTDPCNHRQRAHR